MNIKRFIHTAVALSTLSLSYAQTKVKNLPLLKEEKLEFIQDIEIHGDKPTVIYVPITHDGPMNHVSSTNLDNLKSTMKECEAIAKHLAENYGVSNILLEGCGKNVADYYNKLEGTDKKISFAHTKMLVFETWGNILNERRWNLAHTTETPTYGPLTVLGSEYDNRIKNALSTAQKNGWFSTREVFVTNQKAFSQLITDAVEGYNDKRAAILKEDPKLEREYDLTVAQRNKDFIKNITDKNGPGIIMCGSGHLHDLKKQLIAKGDSFMVVVPKSLAWPIKEKTENEKYEDMLKQGAKLKKCSLKFGDGTSADIQIPIK